jgi:hypothetical protein
MGRENQVSLDAAFPALFHSNLPERAKFDSQIYKDPKSAVYDLIYGYSLILYEDLYS